MIKKPLLVSGAAIIAALVCGSAVHAQNVPIAASNWTTDRYAPAAVTNPTIDGLTALQLTISSAQDASHRAGGLSSSFYNTQGVYQAVNAGAAMGPWTLSGEIYYDPTITAPASESVWATTGKPNDGYYILDIDQNLNPRAAGGATTPGTTVEIWNDLTGDWTSVADPLTSGWNSFSISSDGTDAVTYTLDGVALMTQTGMGGPDGDPDIGYLSGMFFEGYNDYGQGNGAPVTGSYTAAVANLNYSTPDSSSLLLEASVLGSLLAAVSRRKRSASRSA